MSNCCSNLTLTPLTGCCSTESLKYNTSATFLYGPQWFDETEWANAEAQLNIEKQLWNRCVELMNEYVGLWD